MAEPKHYTEGGAQFPRPERPELTNEEKDREQAQGEVFMKSMKGMLDEWDNRRKKAFDVFQSTGKWPADYGTPLTRQEQLKEHFFEKDPQRSLAVGEEETVGGEVPERGRPGSRGPTRITIPAKLPDHGIRELFTPEERFLDDASKLTKLPPENRFTQAAAHAMALGNPFSPEKLEEGAEEHEQMVRAGLAMPYVPEGFMATAADYAVKTMKYGFPLAVEVGIPMTTAVVASPLLAAPFPGSRWAYFGLLATTAGAGNTIAQRLRMAGGVQNEYSWEENVAATLVGGIPLIGPPAKHLSKLATVGYRGGMGASMGGAFELSREGLQIMSGKRDELEVKHIAFAGTVGFALGGVLGRLEKALLGDSPALTAKGLLNKHLKEDMMIVKDLIKQARKEGDPGLAQAGERRLKKVREQLKRLAPEHLQVLDDAIAMLDKQKAEAALLHHEAAMELMASKIMKKRPPRFEDSGEVPVHEDGLHEGKTYSARSQTYKNAEQEYYEKNPEAKVEPLPEVTQKLPADLAGAKPRYKFGTKGINYRLNFDNDVDLALFTVAGSKKLSDRDKSYLDWLRDEVFQGKLKDEEIRNLGQEIKDLIKTQAKAKPAGESLDVPRHHLEAEAPAPVAAPRPVSTKEKETGEALPEEAGAALDDRAKKSVVDFSEGKGIKETDAELLDDAALLRRQEEIKARLFSSDEEEQRLINVIADNLEDLLSQTRGRNKLTQSEYETEVTKLLRSHFGDDAADEYATVLTSGRLAPAGDVADAMHLASVHQLAHGVLLASKFKDANIYLNGQDISNPEVMAEGAAMIFKLIPNILGFKKMGVRAGQMLQSRKIVKNELETAMQAVDADMETHLISNLKRAKDMTPEQLEAQLKTYGDITAIKTLLKAVRDAEDVQGVYDILVKQQQGFQNKSSYRRWLDKGEHYAAYRKIRDVAHDYAFFSYLSAPVTHMKIWIGNAIMARYNAVLGVVGSKFMALTPWGRQGKTKQDFEDAGRFWKGVMFGLNGYGELAKEAGRRAFKANVGEVDSHFEKLFIGTALSKERTGIEGPWGQTLENLGKLVLDLPGRNMARMDARSRLVFGNAMVRAKAEYDWSRATRAGDPDMPKNFDDYYQTILKRVFAEDRTTLKTEDMVVKEAIIASKTAGVEPKNLPAFIDDYLAKHGPDTLGSGFLKYVERNRKEITLTEELGEFSQINRAEKMQKAFEDQVRQLPLLQALAFPFIRTWRNLTREAVSTTAALGEIPGFEAIYRKTMGDLNSGDPIVMARARGRQVFGAGLIATAVTLAKTGYYVGNQRQNWRKKENANLFTGLGDYELRLPTGDGGWVGIDTSALEPFASVFNIAADCVYLMENGTYEQQAFGSQYLFTLQTVVTNNLTNKSYAKNLAAITKHLTTVSEHAEGGDYQKSRLAIGLMGALVPSAFNAVAVATDDSRRRADEVLFALKKRVGLLSQEVPAYRDVFGDIVPLHASDYASDWAKISQSISWINPFKTRRSTATLDKYVTKGVTGGKAWEKLNEEAFANVDLNDPKQVRDAAWAIIVATAGEYPFNGGTTKNAEGIDLQSHVDDEGQDAFSRWQELYSRLRLKYDRNKGGWIPHKEGRNVKEALVEAFLEEFKGEKNEYNRPLMDFKSLKKADLPYSSMKDPRRKKATDILTFFRKQAYGQLLEEFPELKEVEMEADKRQFHYFPAAQPGKVRDPATGDILQGGGKPDLEEVLKETILEKEGE